MASISSTSMASEKSRSAVRQRVVLAATIGNTLWYDFLICGFLAVTIAKLFFPAEDELTSVLLSVGLAKQTFNHPAQQIGFQD